MEDCDNHLQQPWEEAKPKKKTTETLPDDFSTLCRVTITTDGGGGGVEAVMQEIEGEAQEKQQQHGEGKQLKKKMMKKKNDKKKKKNKRGPLRASNTRSFTPEEKEAYHKQVEETEVCISIPWVPWVNVYVHVLCLSTSFSLPIFESLIVVYMCARSYIFNLNGMTFCMPRGLVFWTSPLM